MSKHWVEYKNLVYEEVDYGDISIDELVLAIEDFINEWKSLKGLK